MADTPRLDKFVMRGYTASSGNSSGSWVSREQSSQPVSGNQMDSKSGTSFTMGNTGRAYKAPSKGPDYDLSPDTTSDKKGSARHFGGVDKSKKGRDKERNPAFDAARLISGDGLANAELSENTRFIKGALVVLVFLAFAYYYYQSGDDGSLRRPAQKNGSRAISQTVTTHPVWSRD